MNALVVSSGGSKGSYAGGIIDYLSLNKTWDVFVGSSTGSLIVPLVAAGDIQSLKHVYTTIDSSDIFSRNPFIIKSNANGIFKYKMNHWNLLKNLFEDKKSFGTTYRLRNLISKIFTEDHYNRIIESGKDVQICVTNLTLNTLEVKSIKDYDYENFCDWIWASTCAPPFMSVVEKNNYDYVDGGLISPIPVKQAVLSGADDIDVIVLNKEERDHKIEKVRNVLHLIQLVGRTMFYTQQMNNLDLHRLIKEVKIEHPANMSIYYTKRELTNNPLFFDKELMEKWWEEGYQDAKEGTSSKFVLTKRYIRNI